MRQPTREALIEEILGINLHPRVRGRGSVSVCQLCGRLGHFSGGWIVAMSVHAGGEFVCTACRGRVAASRVGDENAPTVGVRLAEMAHRFCSVCQGRVERSDGPLSRGRWWLCQECRRILGADLEALSEFIWRRAIAVTRRTTHDLSPFDSDLRAMALALTAIARPRRDQQTEGRGGEELGGSPRETG